MSQKVDLDRIWRAARVRADAALDQHGGALLSELPAGCPFGLDDLVAERFDINAAVERVRDSCSDRPPIRDR